MLRDLRCDRLFLAAQAADADCASDTAFELVQLEHATIEAAAFGVLAADSSRFGTRVLCRISETHRFGAIVTDAGLPMEERQNFAARGLDLMIVPIGEQAQDTTQA